MRKTTKGAEAPKGKGAKEAPAKAAGVALCLIKLKTYNDGLNKYEGGRTYMVTKEKAARLMGSGHFRKS